MNLGKLIIGIYGALFAAVAVWAVVFFVQMHRDITVLRAQEALNQRRLAEAEAKLAAQEKYLNQLRNDPVLVERLIREKLRYSKGEEFVFRFEDSEKK